MKHLWSQMELSEPKAWSTSVACLLQNISWQVTSEKQRQMDILLCVFHLISVQNDSIFVRTESRPVIRRKEKKTL